MCEIAEIEPENLLEPFATDGQTGFVTVAQVFIQFGRQFDGFRLVPGFEALADVWLPWKCDSALPDWRHGVGTLIDDDPTVAEFPFGCCMKAHDMNPDLDGRAIWA